MSIAVFLKNNLRNIPPRIGKLINEIPYSIRPGIGKIYRERQDEIHMFETYSDYQKREFIFNKVKQITHYAYANISFYKDHYNNCSFNPSSLKSFDDIQRIPIINKVVLAEYDIEQRSAKTKGRYVVNTGGSSGTPFSFYIEPSSMGHEWVHMHHVWKKLGYESSELKIVFGGRSDLKDVVEYDVVRNHFAIDIYADYKLIAKKLKKILGKYKIKYLHGYPSSIYDFAIFCKTDDNELQSLLSKSLEGAFLGSEYPYPHYRDAIEEIFSIKTISWYGHTERAVLAYEKQEKYKYEPFGTYGFSEALKLDEDGFQLIATSYYNFASPLIRYNTNDIISDITEDSGMLTSFKVTKGREGEFILDHNEKKISLTGLIFGRHHEIFNHSKFIQVRQAGIGEIEVHFVSNDLSENKANELFDKRNLNLDITFVKRDEPYRTNAGKVNLLIK